LTDNSIPKKAHCTKKKTHEAFQGLRSFVLNDLKVPNVNGSIQKRNITEGEMPLTIAMRGRALSQVYSE
jgi:hypothetical protein